MRRNLAANDPNVLYKDRVLNRLAKVANVAQFVSFSDELKQRFAWVRGFPPNHKFDSIAEAVESLFNSAPEKSLNVRSFEPNNPKSREFIYGLSNSGDVISVLNRLSANGLDTIVNETIDIHDGGVSGVAIGDTLEFAPGDTPRCVEKPGTASFPRQSGLAVLENVYQFRPQLKFEPSVRVEFSVHPLRRGYRHDHTILWELEEMDEPGATPKIYWPNRFSRFLGDKAFGLLVAHHLGLPVPETTVIARSVPPFRFGTRTGSGEIWIRTCPIEQVPGRFTTQRGWLDPVKLMTKEDPEGQRLASVLSQEGIDAVFSGGLGARKDGQVIIEGVRGSGVGFMVGLVSPEPLPAEVIKAVTQTYEHASSLLGPIRMEWVYDGSQAWVVQLHPGTIHSFEQVIYPGEVKHYERFKVTEGLEALRDRIPRIKALRSGVVLVGRVGVTSHLGDLLRKAKVPSRIEYD